MRVPASYYETPGGTPRLIYVRVHSKMQQQGDLKGTSMDYAEREEVIPRVLFWCEEVKNPRRDGLVIISATEGYRVGQTEPRDIQSITAEVTPLTPADIVGRTLPADLVP